MKKILFFFILLGIISYGIVSNYKKKIEKQDFSVFNKNSNLEGNEYGCEKSGVLGSYHCRIEAEKCKKDFLKPLEKFYELSFTFKGEILHCTSYKIGPDPMGFDIILESKDAFLIENKRKKVEKISNLQFFSPGDGLCIIPENQKIKYGIKSKELRDTICEKIRKNSDVSIAQKKKSESVLNIIFLKDNLLWLNESSY